MALPVVRSSQPTTGWDPFRELNELHTQLHRWMDSVLERTSGLTADPLSWSPLADLSETEDAYLVEVEVPGVSREDISIDLSGTELVITGERKEREREGWFRHRTRSVGRFHYAVTLPRDIDPDGVDATLSQGVLTVRIPRARRSSRGGSPLPSGNPLVGSARIPRSPPLPGAQDQGWLRWLPTVRIHATGPAATAADRAFIPSGVCVRCSSLEDLGTGATGEERRGSPAG